jgi:peptidoglycan/xylan/chitin deacetylase (PgdA/CDA1 family)
VDDYDADWQGRRARREQARRRRARRRRLALALAALALVGAGTAAFVPAGSKSKVAARQLPRHRTVRRQRQEAVVRARNLQPSHAAVPILMYHVIAPPPLGAPFPGLYVDPAQFAAQIEALVHAGYHAVTQDEMLAAWRGAASLPRHPIVVSFDNGYRSQYANALPILRRVRWVGEENLQLSGLPPSAGGLTPREVRALVAAGWELDTQGWSHADLVEADPAKLHFEVVVARARIRRLYGVPANWFCYPSGRFDATVVAPRPAAVVAAVQAAGFVGATTVVPGWARPADDLYELPRLRVLRGTTPAELLAQIRDAA